MSEPQADTGAELGAETVPPDPEASQRGLSAPRDKKWDPIRAHDETAATIATRLVLLFFITLYLIICVAAVTAWWHPGSLKDLVAFFAVIVSALGTLLGGITGYYYGKSRGHG